MTSWTWRCPDCGGRIAFPLDLHAIATAIANGTPAPPLDKAGMRDIIGRHVAWNPDIHPSFVKREGES